MQINHHKFFELVNAKKLKASYNQERGYTSRFHGLIRTVRENSWSSTQEQMYTPRYDKNIF